MGRTSGTKAAVAPAAGAKVPRRASAAAGATTAAGRAAASRAAPQPVVALSQRGRQDDEQEEEEEEEQELPEQGRAPQSVQGQRPQMDQSAEQQLPPGVVLRGLPQPPNGKFSPFSALSPSPFFALPQPIMS